MAIFLAAPDLPRLARLLVLHRPVEPAVPIPLSAKPWVNRWSAVVFHVLGWGLGTWMCVWGWMQFYKITTTPKPPYYGVWQIDEFNAGHSLFTEKITTALKLHPGDEGWERLIFDQPKRLQIQLSNENLDSVALALDPKTNHATLTDSKDNTWKADLDFQASGDKMTVHGPVNGVEVTAKLHRIPESEYTLVSRGFHWINEHPF
jgi:hypothetical protein